MSARARPSTQNLAALPDPFVLWKRCVALDLLDRMLGGSLRRFTLEMEWRPGVPRLLSDNGAGDCLFVAFAPKGVFLKGFDHHSPMSPHASATEDKLWPGLFDKVPKSLMPFIDEPITPGMRPIDCTFCLTYLHAEGRWACGVKKFPRDPNPGDGSRIWLSFLTHDAAEHRSWLEDYLERRVPLALVEAVFAHRPITAAEVRRVNAEADAESILASLKGVDYGGPGPIPAAVVWASKRR